MTQAITLINRPKALWLVDASIYIYRPWYTGDNTHVDDQGESIHAYLGFTQFVDQLLSNEQPESIAFAFDAPQTNSWRRALYPRYKHKRKARPDNLNYQINLCQHYINNLGIINESSDYYEADDIIASWANNSTEAIIVSADKDLTQLIRPQDLWCDYDRNYQLNYYQIQQKFGVQPEQIADLLALAGDKADNIPGITGVGIATAAKLLQRFGDIDNLLQSIEKIGKLKFRGAYWTQKAIEEEQDNLRLYRQLTGLACKAVSPLI